MEILLVGELVARSHFPITILFRIPGYRQFDQLSIGGSMKKASCLITRTNHVVNTFLRNICFFTIEANLVAALIVLVTATNHCVVITGSLVVNRVSDSKVFRHVVRGRRGN